VYRRKIFAGFDFESCKKKGYKTVTIFFKKGLAICFDMWYYNSVERTTTKNLKKVVNQNDNDRNKNERT
jgi:hypothetical protein